MRRLASVGTGLRNNDTFSPDWRVHFAPGILIQAEYQLSDQPEVKVILSIGSEPRQPAVASSAGNQRVYGHRNQPGKTLGLFIPDPPPQYINYSILN